MTEPVIVPHPNTIRGPIESTHNGIRDAREKTFVAAKTALEDDYHDDLAQIQTDKEDALVAAGLNPDGGVPSDYGFPAANTAVPTITGTTEVGDVLTAHTGTWRGEPPPSFAYQWQHANPDGSSVTNINGATSSTYTLVSGDAGKKVRVQVTGTDTAGGSAADSAYTAVVGTTPSNSVAPTITGTPTVGQVLTAHDGTWAGTPSPVFTHQWVRTDADDTNRVNINGATSATYTLVSGDTGKKILVHVTGTNAVGAASEDSSPTAAVSA